MNLCTKLNGEKMIINKPFPLLEASFFLADRASGKSSRKFFEERIHCDNAINEQTRKYAQLLIELETRLEKSITADESIIEKLFKPFTSGTDNRVVSTDFAANFIVQNIINYADTESCFDSLRNNGEKSLNNSVYSWISKTTNFISSAERLIDSRELFDAVNESLLPAEAKMLILDISMHYSKYVDMLEAAVSPVAKAFETCSDLVHPLIDVYSKDFNESTDLSQYKLDIFGETQNHFDSVDVFPLITYYQNRLVLFDYGTDGGCTAKLGVGALYHYMAEHYGKRSDDAERLSSYLNAIGGKNRFNIVSKLAEGPVYGRELARMLNVSPANISQHMSLLLADGIVKLENEGSKVYYSLNRDCIREFIELQKKVFLKEQPTKS
ncbi:MAG TPA: hypothetical protein DCY17_03200 [Clostridiales bacterium]|nr:hypothetical protein [Clostridiales bacterium]